MASPVPSPVSAIVRDKPGAQQARAIAQILLEGFNKHYALFRECARAAKRHFEAGNWLAIQHVGRDRIDFYDRRVHETAERILRDFGFAGLDSAEVDALWEQVKLHFIGLLLDHKQPECAETFFNSVSVKTLGRGYFHNRLIFIRPALSTEHIDADPPSYRSYYPLQQGLRHALIDIVLDFGFERPFADFGRDLRNLLARVPRAMSAAVPSRSESPDPGALLAVLPQSDRLSRRARRQRQPHVSVRRPDQARRPGQALRRRAADGRSRSRAAVLGESRVLPRRHGSPVGVRRLPVGDRRRQDAPPSSTRWSGCRKAARTCSSATSSTISSTRATSSSSPRASRGW